MNNYLQQSDISELQHQTYQAGSTLGLLEEWFKPFDSCIVAFSAGVDSSLLAFCAERALRERALAVTTVSPSFSEKERENALLMAKEIGIETFIIEQADLASVGYVRNGIDRCYFCRNNLASAILPVARKLSIDLCVDGTQTDDMRTPRPGIKALREAGFRAPFVELGINKEAIRIAAKSVGLSNWNRPSEACLSSRIAFGQRIESATLRMIEKAETIVKRVTNARIVRVRTIGDKACVEVDTLSVGVALSKRSIIASRLRDIGYSEVEIDPSGYTSGKMLQLFVHDNA